MRPYRNINDSELDTLGALREWSSDTVRNLSLPAKVLWVHCAREKYHPLDTTNNCLIKIITVETIQDEIIRTNFGNYSIDTGKNILYVSGSKKLCDCYGQLYLLKDSHALSDRHTA